LACAGCQLPAAEEGADLAVLQRVVGDRHRERVDDLVVAQGLEQGADERVRRGDVGPARIRHLHRLTAVRIGRGGRPGRVGGAEQERQGDRPTATRGSVRHGAWFSAKVERDVPSVTLLSGRPQTSREIGQINPAAGTITEHIL
jgi:hypothetical protein